MSQRSKQQLQQVGARRSVRPGEGAVVGFVTKHVSNPDGTSAVSLTLNLSDAPVPDRRYLADAGMVKQRGDHVTLAFGQRTLDGSGYRSLLLIELSSTSALQIIDFSKDLMRKAAAYATEVGVTPLPLDEIKNDVPGQTIPFAANLCASGFTGRDACMDFYYASPFAIQQATHGADFVAEAVVRVSLSTALMLAMFARLQELESSLPRDRVLEQL